MGNPEIIPNSLEQKHRKEKKELQSQIMALRKTIKGDKTKKKEITTEICRLETELEEKHKRELEENRLELEEEIEPLPEETGTSLSAGFAKVSKAQKRRDKKMQEERERNERIKMQEKDNLHGPRNLESLAISSKLKDSKLVMHLIPSDGDCMYKAISHQLESTERKVLSVRDLRTVASNYIRENKDDFLPFMSNPETFEMLTDEEFEEYCRAIADTKTWGGQLEIRALSCVLQCPVHVVQAEGQDRVRQGDQFGGVPLIITYHRHMYSLGEHYNSTVKADTVVTESH